MEPEWLERFFADDLRRGMVDSPLSTSDVWPENYSANSVQKVWAAKLAARHPNLVVLDLSSFKCGHDAPTYGLIDHILKLTEHRDRDLLELTLSKALIDLLAVQRVTIARVMNMRARSTGWM